MMRSTAAWLVIAGLLGFGRWLLEYTDAEYYDPQSAFDYLAVSSQSAAGISTAVMGLSWIAFAGWILRQLSPAGNTRQHTAVP